MERHKKVPLFFLAFFPYFKTTLKKRKSIHHMVVVQGQTGAWMRTPISLIAYTYASHSENTTLMHIKVMHRLQNNQRRGVELWSFFLMLQTTPALVGNVQCPLFCSQISVWVGAETARLSWVQLPLLVIWVNFTLDSSKQTRLCALSHTQTSCPAYDKNGTNYMQLNP